MKINTVLITLILAFMLWFVWVMYSNPQDFNYYASNPAINGDLTEENDLAIGKVAFEDNLKKNYVLHYYLLKYQFWIFLAIVIFAFPTKKVKKLWRKFLNIE